MVDNSGLKNEKKVSELLISGSVAIKTKNDFGVHIFSGSVDDDGILFGKLSKPGYNDGELVKSIDTTIIELIPIEAPILPETVLKSIYDEALLQIDDLTAEVERLNDVVSDLTAKVTELEIVTQSLRVELDGRELLVASTQNDNRQSISKVQTTIVDLQNSIQKATAESIQRISLTARNETLLNENELLREQLFGKTAKLQEGFRVTEDFAIRVVNIADNTISDLTFNSRPNQNGQGKWLNGPDIEISNFTTDSVTINFTQIGNSAGMIDQLSPVTIPANDSKTISVKANETAVDNFAPKRTIGTAGDRRYRGNLVASSNRGKVNIPMELQKQAGDRFNPNI
jgi:hypothetical protein